MRTPIFLAAILVSGSISAAPELTQTEAQAAVDDVAASLPAIRGLDFTAKVPVQVVDDAVARKHVLARMKKFMPEEEFRMDARAWSLLGILPQGVDVVSEFLDVLEEQAGGFYDPEAKSFYLLDDMPAAIAPVLAAHELVHALEDQHYDLDKRIAAAKGNDDEMFAIGSVHEGSATIAMSVYLAQALNSGKMKMDALQSFQDSEAAKAEKLKAMPEALQRQLIGPYVLGMSFLLHGDLQAAANGFPKDDVARVYRGGPVSSEQILHPEKYWDPAKRDLPKTVSLEGAGRLLGSGWQKAASGILGELMIGSMVGAGTPGAETLAGSAASWTNDAAAGWGGDRWELWRKGDAYAVLLATAWDTPADAAEFAKALSPREGFRWKVSGSRVAVVSGTAPEAGAAKVLAKLAP